VLGEAGVIAPSDGAARGNSAVVFVISLEALILVVQWLRKPVRPDSTDSNTKESG
jgi:hypothetical protein